MSAAIPSAFKFPPWSISPSSIRNASTPDTNTAAIVGAIVLFFFVVAAAIFTLRKRLSLSWTKKHDGKWHDMESNGGKKIALSLAAARSTHAPDHTYHGTTVVTVAPGVQDHRSYVCPYDGRLEKSSPLTAPLKLSTLKNHLRSPFGRFGDRTDQKRCAFHKVCLVR